MIGDSPMMAMTDLSSADWVECFECSVCGAVEHRATKASDPEYRSRIDAYLFGDVRAIRVKR